MIKGALPVGILGIGEPLIYGVTLPLGRPFITACIGGGIGGAVIGASVMLVRLLLDQVGGFNSINCQQPMACICIRFIGCLRRWFCSNVILWDS